VHSASPNNPKLGTSVFLEGLQGGIAQTGPARQISYFSAAMGAAVLLSGAVARLSQART
jgi:hypothetical protein